MEQTFPLVIVTVLPKNKSFEMPENVRAYSKVRCRDHVPLEYKDLLDIVNFDEDDAYIMKIDNNRLMPKSDRLFFSVFNITGITKEQIEGERGEREVSFARYLFWLGMKRLSSLSLKAIGEITNNDHATVLTGIKKIGYIPVYGEKPQQEMLNKFLKENKIKLGSDKNKMN